MEHSQHRKLIMNEETTKTATYCFASLNGLKAHVSFIITNSFTIYNVNLCYFSESIYISSHFNDTLNGTSNLNPRVYDSSAWLNRRDNIKQNVTAAICFKKCNPRNVYLQELPSCVQLLQMTEVIWWQLDISCSELVCKIIYLIYIIFNWCYFCSEGLSKEYTPKYEIRTTVKISHIVNRISER